MKSLFFGLILAYALFSAETEDIFFGLVNRGDLRGERVSVSGFVNATGCEKLPCKIMAYRWLGSTKVLFILNFPNKFAPIARRKRALDPVRVSCVMISDFEYSECYL
ncbi:MAG: hypothetical protein LBF86_04795 [Helicobacteraceae bacterium]|jgi:hypothetical protein|nr:hypothetical protein [Helicobacteraceae bacterium]